MNRGQLQLNRVQHYGMGLLMALHGNRRLPAEDRRAQLLRLGAGLFNSRELTQISVDEIARAAGISKGLLYHYFGGKREFFLAGLRQSAEQFMAACLPDSSLPYPQQVAATIRGYLDYVEAHAPAYLNLVRHATAAVPELAEVCEETRTAISDRMLSAIGPDEPTPATRIAVRGYMAFTEAVVLDWLENGNLDRKTLEKLLASCLCQALSTAVPLDLPPHCQELQTLQRVLRETRELFGIEEQPGVSWARKQTSSG